MKFTALDQDEAMYANNGTSLQGYIDAHYFQLVETFGEPFDGDMYKTQKEWSIEFADGTIATIYDWKKDCDPQNNTIWNVGGKSERAFQLVIQTIQHAYAS